MSCRSGRGGAILLDSGCSWWRVSRRIPHWLLSSWARESPVLSRVWRVISIITIVGVTSSIGGVGSTRCIWAAAVSVWGITIRRDRIVLALSVCKVASARVTVVRTTVRDGVRLAISVRRDLGRGSDWLLTNGRLWWRLRRSSRC